MNAPLTISDPLQTVPVSRVQAVCQNEWIMVGAAGVLVFVVLLMWQPPLVTDDRGRLDWFRLSIWGLVAVLLAVVLPRMLESGNAT